jgi:UDP-N-acetylglucosamine 2-epimerase (non-hydrolysing)
MCNRVGKNRRFPSSYHPALLTGPTSVMPSVSKPVRVAFVFGTRPECIKLAPVIRAVGQHAAMEPIVISSSQHTDLLTPFLKGFGIRVDHDLKVMRPGQTPGEVLSKALSALEPLLRTEKLDLVIVQGDTTTALAGALAAFHAEVPVGHVEAGLRTGDIRAPFPEEMNRRLISRLATYHFAATRLNVETLLSEGVPSSAVWQTGNPIVDALHWILEKQRPSESVAQLVESHAGKKIIVLTTHRRESFGTVMIENLRALARFVGAHPNCVVVFPVHPNPNVRKAVDEALSGASGIEIVDPLDYADFIHLLSAAWMIVSDSGGVQEEAPSLGKRLIVLRRNTERPEVVQAGIAKLIGDDPLLLENTLKSADSDSSWITAAGAKRQLFGSGDAAQRIVQIILSAYAKGD